MAEALPANTNNTVFDSHGGEWESPSSVSGLTPAEQAQLTAIYAGSDLSELGPQPRRRYAPWVTLGTMATAGLVLISTAHPAWAGSIPSVDEVIDATHGIYAELTE